MIRHPFFWAAAALSPILAMALCQAPACVFYPCQGERGPHPGGRRTMRHGSDGSHLLRVLGVAFGIAAVIGGTIGQGILRSPGVVAAGVAFAWVVILLLGVRGGG